MTTINETMDEIMKMNNDLQDLLDYKSDDAKEQALLRDEQIYELWRCAKIATPEVIFEALKEIDKEQLNNFKLIINSLLNK